MYVRTVLIHPFRLQYPNECIVS